MTPDEALDYALELVEELRQQGVPLTVTPYKEKTKPKHYAEVVAQYGGKPERASPEKWVKVKFKPVTQEQRNAIHAVGQKIGWLGAFYDHGGGCGEIDWEFDWSFRYTGQPDADREQVVSSVNDLMDGLNNGTIEGPAGS